jgi:spoIIIJ-associated protein
MENVQKESCVMEKKRKSVEVEGANVEDAIKKAMALLKVAREDLEVKVVCEEQKGLFGMEGAKPAKIKVSIKNK